MTYLLKPDGKSNIHHKYNVTPTHVANLETSRCVQLLVKQRGHESNNRMLMKQQ